MRFAATVSQEDGVYIAHCIGVDIAAEGPTQEAAVETLKRELELYMKEAPAVGPPESGPRIEPIEVVVTDSVPVGDASKNG